MNSYVYSFDELVEPKLSEVGGKATNLINLSNIDEINLPEGFCITTTAYTEIFNSNKELDSLLTQLWIVNTKLDNLSKVKRSIFNWC
jgi:pyruvate,water dikinase